MYVIVKAGKNTSCCYINSEGGVTQGIGGDTISSDIGGFVTTAYKFKTKGEALFILDSLGPSSRYKNYEPLEMIACGS